MSVTSSISLQQQIRQQGFIHVTEDNVLTELQQRSDFEGFKQSWNDLPPDNHLSDLGNYRFRRYSVFNYINNELIQLSIEPHYQSREYNKVNGGYYRYFSELQPEIANSPILRQLIEWNSSLISTKEQKDWRIQCHQFRICASKEEAGKPSPEGIHQDGSDYVFIMLLERQNIIGALNTIHNDAGDVLYETTMTEQGEVIVVNDKRYWHGVGKVYPDDENQPSYRDVLVLTFHAQ